MLGDVRDDDALVRERESIWTEGSCQMQPVLIAMEGTHAPLSIVLTPPKRFWRCCVHGRAHDDTTMNVQRILGDCAKHTKAQWISSDVCAQTWKPERRNETAT